MAWPTGQEYSEAVQNPRQAFENPELRGGRIEVGHLGLPRPRSGSFAVVYRIDCGMRSWAVKCFTREVVDQQRRYADISAHLQRSAVPYTVAFEYLARGIRVGGGWFPALKMEWVSGEPLIRFIESHLQDPASLRALASRWVEMLKTLRAAAIAHGDLQHGNVLILGGDLKLVDYDGMFVPALSGVRASETGHPNYQHPGRAELPFGPDLDNFSAWSIYVSLIALSIDPSLWSRVKGGDDCLLFRASDFAAPERSEAFRTVAASSDEGLRSLIQLFSELLRLKVEGIPPLDAAKIRIGPASVPGRSHAASWLEDHIKSAQSTVTREVSPEASNDSEVIDASWVLDFITPVAGPEDARFVHSVFWLRLLLVCSIFLSAATFLTVPGLALPLVAVALLVGANLVVSAATYRNEPGLASLEQARTALRECNDRFRVATARAAELERGVKARDTRRDQDLASVDGRVRGTDERTGREVDGVRRRLERECVDTQKRRREVDDEERRALGAVSSGTGARAGTLQNQLQALAREEATELAKVLADLQGVHLRTAVSSATVAGAHIPGVGPQLKTALVANGITCAKDVDRWRVYRISGFGPARANAVLAWAAGIEQRARAGMPQAVSASEAQSIGMKYTARRRTLGEELERVETQRRGEEGSIRARATAMRREVDSLEAAPRATAAHDIQAIQGSRDKAVSLLRSEEHRVIEAAKADLAALGVELGKLKRSALGRQWEKARAATQVKAYAPVTFGRYLLYVTCGAGRAG
jgi:hypothetical protein